MPTKGYLPKQVPSTVRFTYGQPAVRSNGFGRGHALKRVQG